MANKIADRSPLIGIALLALASGVFYFVQIHPLVLAPERIHGNDFWHLYLAGRCIQVEEDFYDFETIQRHRLESGVDRGINPFVYLPFTALLFSPLSLAGPEKAKLIWFGINLVLLAVSILFLSLSLPRRRRLTGAVFIILLAGVALPAVQRLPDGQINVMAASFPLRRTLTAGQLNLLLLALISLALFSFSRKRWFLGGVWTGVAGMVKVSPFFLLLFLAWKRRWTAFFGGLAAIVVLMSITTAVMGPQYAFRSHMAAVPVFRDMGYGSSTWSEYGQRFHIDPGNVSPASVVYRLLVGDPGIPHPDKKGSWLQEPTPGVYYAPSLAKGICIGMALSLIGLLGWFTRKPKESDPIPLEYSCAAIAMLLIPSLLWDHYLLLLYPALLFLFDHSWTRPRLGFTLLWLLPALFLMRPYLFADPAFRSGWKTLLMAPHGFLVLLLYGQTLWLVRKRRKALQE